jgi:hypothetical protein
MPYSVRMQWPTLSTDPVSEFLLSGSPPNHMASDLLYTASFALQPRIGCIDAPVTSLCARANHLTIPPSAGHRDGFNFSSQFLFQHISGLPYAFGN